MGEWADRAFELLKDKEGEEHLRIQRDLQIRDQILRYAPDRWLDLRSKLGSEIKDFCEMRPQYLGMTDTYESVILHSPKCDVEIKFSQEHPKVTYGVKHRPNATTSIKPLYGTFSFIVKDQSVWFQLEAGPGTQDLDRTGVPLTADEVAVFLLNKLI